MPVKEEWSLSADETSSPHSQGPPTPHTSPNKGSRPGPHQVGSSPLMPFFLSCSQASGLELDEASPSLDMELSGAVKDDTHFSYQELEQFLQYHSTAQPPLNYGDYSQDVYRELQPSKPTYQAAQVNPNEMSSVKKENKCIHCPDCLKAGRKSVVKHYKPCDDFYLILCTYCDYTKECEEEPQMSEQDIEEYGFPGELLQHMDVYEEDIGKIGTIALIEYYNNEFLVDKTNVLTLHMINTIKAKNRSLFNTNINLFKKMDLPSVITPSYKMKVKEAFCKIKDYSFPTDFVKNLLKNKDTTNEDRIKN